MIWIKCLRYRDLVSEWWLPSSAGQCRYSRTRTCLTAFCPVWHGASSCQTECLTSFKSFQEVWTTERNLTKLDRKQVLNVLYQVCVFRADPKNNMAALASDWLRHILTFPLKPLNGIQRNLTGSKILTSSTKFVFFGAEKWIKIATLANPSKKVAHCTQVDVMGPFGPLVYEFI